MTCNVNINPTTQSQLRNTFAGINSNVEELDSASGSVSLQDGTASGAITAGDVLYSPSAGTVSRAQANSLTTSRVVGIAVADAVNAAAVQYRPLGVVTITGYTLTTDRIYFLSAVTAGALVTAPDATTAGNYVVKIGVSVGTTSIIVNPEAPIGY